MRLFIIFLLLLVSTSGFAETKYYCEGDTTRTMNNGPRVEDPDTKQYVFNGNEIEFFTDKVKCTQDKKSIHCRSNKFNRTLEINKLTGYTTDVYEAFSNGQPHVKIEFVGMCELY
jgi:hypothetical protein